MVPSVSDSGHSFDSVLFFGNERMLLVFEVLLFCLIDVVVHNFVLAGILTFAIAYVSTFILPTVLQLLHYYDV